METESRLSAIVDLLESTNIPFAYESWPEAEVPQMPYIVYRETDSVNFFADGAVFFSASRIQIALYTKMKDIRLEGRIETALASHFWERSENYIDSERCYQILYEIEV